MKLIFLAFIIILVSCGATGDHKHRNQPVTVIRSKSIIPVDTLCSCLLEAAALFPNNNTVSAIEQIFQQRSDRYNIIYGNNPENSDQKILIYSVTTENENSNKVSSLLLNIPDSLQSLILIKDLVKLLGSPQKPSPLELVKKEYFDVKFYYKPEAQKEATIINVTTSYPYNYSNNKVFYITLKRS
ncbi:MAG: hypothetical protein QM640_02610 [Niabella sp.]